MNKQNKKTERIEQDSFEYDLHPHVKEVSRKLCDDGHYAQAVEEAFKKVIKVVKKFYEALSEEDRDGDTLMNHAFGCVNRDPVIKFNKLGGEEERDEQTGIMYLFKGIVAIR